MILNKIIESSLPHPHTPVFVVNLLLQNCVTQIFDTREVMVTQNTTLAEEFNTNIKLFFQSIDQKIGKQTAEHICTCDNVHLTLCVCVCVCVGEANEFGQRQQVMWLCALMVLQFQIYNVFDTKLTKQVWDLHKKVSIVHLMNIGTTS